MTTYIVLDSSGSRKGTVKAQSKLGALKIFIGVENLSAEVAMQWTCIPKDIANDFRKNVNAEVRS